MVDKKYLRSISFPAPSPPLSASRRAALAKSSYRTRSASLPTRLHPLEAHLHNDLTALQDWSSSPTTISSLADGLALLHLLLSSLPELLRLPQNQHPLQRRPTTPAPAPTTTAICVANPPPPLADRLLDDFLRLADAHGIFRQAALDLKSLLANTRSALRREPRRLSSCLRAQRRTERDVARLAAAVRYVGRRPPPALPPAADEAEAEVALVLRQVVAASAATSAAVFSGVASASAAAVPARTWLEEGLARWRWRARAKNVMRRELSEKLTVEKALLRWRSRAKAKGVLRRELGGKGTVESALKGWLARARSGVKEKSKRAVEPERKGFVETALRRWVDRAKARTKMEAGELKGKWGAVEAGLMRWLSRAKARSRTEDSAVELGQNVIGCVGEMAVIAEGDENLELGDENLELGNVSVSELVLVEKREVDRGGVLFEEHRCCKEEKDEEWRKAAMKRLAVLEDRVAALESGSELVFRDLINVRVALLNILTPCF